MKIGIAFSGGGAKGIAHLGVIQALQELGITFSIMSGASSGAIVATLFSYGYQPLEILGFIRKMNAFKSLRFSWRLVGGLLSTESLKRMLMENMPENSFDHLKIPVVISATNLKQGGAEYFSDGNLADVLTASCCVPGIFSPAMINGEPYIDGGVLDNLPVKPIHAQCGFVIGSACNPLGSDFKVGSIKKVIERTMLMAINTNTQISKSLCDIVIEPPGLSKFSGMDVGFAQEIYDIGYTFTKNNFQALDFQRTV